MDAHLPDTATNARPMAPRLELTGSPTPSSWHLDEATREAGRRGVARARAALAATRRREAGDTEALDHRHAA